MVSNKKGFAKLSRHFFLLFYLSLGCVSVVGIVNKNGLRSKIEESAGSFLRMQFCRLVTQSVRNL